MLAALDLAVAAVEQQAAERLPATAVVSKSRGVEASYSAYLVVEQLALEKRAVVLREQLAAGSQLQEMHRQLLLANLLG